MASHAPGGRKIAAARPGPAAAALRNWPERPALAGIDLGGGDRLVRENGCSAQVGGGTHFRARVRPSHDGQPALFDKPSHEAQSRKEPKRLNNSQFQGHGDRASQAAQSQKAKRAQLTPLERKERHRKAAAQRRQNRKEQGLCKDCPNRATPGQTRCIDCAEKHRLIRRANR